MNLQCEKILFTLHLHSPPKETQHLFRLHNKMRRNHMRAKSCLLPLGQLFHILGWMSSIFWRRSVITRIQNLYHSISEQFLGGIYRLLLYLPPRSQQITHFCWNIPILPINPTTILTFSKQKFQPFFCIMRLTVLDLNTDDKADCPN